MADALARETRRLYGLPRTEFTAARNARAKELRRDDPDLAAAVAGLAKPNLAVASVDPELESLLERGTLTEDLAASGFSLDPGLVLVRPTAAKPKPAPKADRKAEEKREATQRLRDAQAALEEAGARMRAPKRDVERATGAVETARRAL